MKKVIIIICCVLLAAAGWGQAVTVDSYPVENGDAMIVYGEGSRYGVGNSFYVPDNCRIDSIVVYLDKVGSPTANTFINIYKQADTSTYGLTSVPQGDSLCRSNNIAASSFTTSSAKYTFTFTGIDRIRLTTGYYVFVHIIYNSDASNYIRMPTDVTTSTHAGNRVQYNISGKSFIPFASRDVIFYVYGVPEVKKVAGVLATSTKKVAGVADASIKKISGKTK